MSNVLQSRTIWIAGICVVMALAAASLAWTMTARGEAPAQDEWPWVVMNPDDQSDESHWFRMVVDEPAHRSGGGPLMSPSANVVGTQCGWASLYARGRSGARNASAGMHVELEPAFGNINYIYARFELQDEWGNTYRWYACAHRSWECNQYPHWYYWSWTTYLTVPYSGELYRFRMPYVRVNTSSSPWVEPATCRLVSGGPYDDEVIW